MNTRRRTVAVYGGSFNPPHCAHVMVAEHVAATPGIDAVWIIPTYRHAFDKTLIAFEHRLRMCELAFGHIERTRVLDIERDLGGRSLMVRTLEALAARHSDVDLRLVIGSDLIDQLERWTEPERIRELAPPLLVQRQGSEHTSATGPVFPDVSSSLVRQRIARNESIHTWVPANVQQYIATHGLYRDAASAT